MKKYCLLLMLLLSMMSLLLSFQIIETPWKTLVAERPADYYGKYLTSLDFNGDGIKDLAVSAYMCRNFDNQRLFWTSGKLYIYYGKTTGFADYPDMTISPDSRPDSLSSYQNFMELVNLGDVNGDGYEDLGVQGGCSTGDEETFTGYLFVKVFFGGSNPDSLADYTFIRRMHEIESIKLRPIGDINGDGYDDMGIAYKYFLNHSYPRYYYNTYLVVYGGTYEEQLFSQEFWGDTNYHNPYIYKCGDINVDGYDDFSITYKPNGLFKTKIFYGSANPDTLADIDLSTITPSYNFLDVGAGYIGDWNGDGYDDFLAYILSDFGTGLSYGRPNYIPQIDRRLYYFDGHRDFFSLGHGDINNDGKDDIALGYITDNGGDGQVYVYMASQNYTIDYKLPGVAMDGHAGYLTMGDYNNDGFCDIAVGAYGDNLSVSVGRVYIYLGSAEFTEQDTALSVQDIIQVPAKAGMIIYPNPSKKTATFKVTNNDSAKNQYQIGVYDIKGRKKAQLKIKTLTKGESRTMNLDTSELPSGVFFCKLISGKEIIAVKKLSIVK